MDVIHGYDKGIKERTLTMYFTEKEVRDWVEAPITDGLTYRQINDTMNMFYKQNELMKVSSVDGENGDVMILKADNRKLSSFGMYAP